MKRSAYRLSVPNSGIVRIRSKSWDPCSSTRGRFAYLSIDGGLGEPTEVALTRSQTEKIVVELQRRLAEGGS